MSYQVIAVEKENHQVTFNNLLSFYLYDLSEFFEIEPVNGRFHYSFDWDHPDKHPFLAFKDSTPVGFAIVAAGSTLNEAKDVWDMEEFFTIRSERRQGLGLWLAHAMYARFAGKWEIRIGEKNLGALSFWRRSLEGAESRDMRETILEGDRGSFYCISSTID